jgi:hypothetical protein
VSGHRPGRITARAVAGERSVTDVLAAAFTTASSEPPPPQDDRTSDEARLTPTPDRRRRQGMALLGERRPAGMASV